MNKFSIFHNGIKNTLPNGEITLKFFLDSIKEDTSLLKKIRVEPDKDKRNILKRKLSYVTFAGVFSKRNNEGLVKGSGLACFDVDDVTNLEEVKQEIIKNEYTHALFESPSGNGFKFLVKIPEITNDEEYKKHWISISEEYNLKDFDEATKDVSRACFVSYDSNPYFNAESKLYTKKSELSITLTKSSNGDDSSRSALEYRRAVAEFRNGKSRLEVEKLMMAYKKFADAPEQYKKLTLDKAESFVLGKREQKFESQEKVFHTYDSIKNILSKTESKEKPILKRFIPEKSLNIIFGEPASCKSIFINHLAICLATGKKFLGYYPIKKTPILYLSSENSEITDRKRFKPIFRSLKINAKRRKQDNLQMFYQGRNNIGLLNSDVYFDSLKDIIRENGIKVLFIDTISPLIHDADDNKASAMVEVFKDRLFSLIDEYGISIITTMHSQKTGRDFLGSVKIKASCDTFFELKRNDNELTLFAHKNRDGEYNITMSVEFENKNEVLNKVNFQFLQEFQGKKEVNGKKANDSKSKECCEFILEMLEGKEMSYSELVKECENEDYALATSKRAITSLYEAKKIKKKHGKRGGYYIA